MVATAMANQPSLFRRLCSLVWWKGASQQPTLTIQGHNGALFTWPLVAVYVICAPAVHWGYMNESTYGVSWVVALMVVLTALTKDFNRTATTIFAGAFLILVVGLGWLGKEIDVPIISNVLNWFKGLDIPGPRDMALLVAGGCVFGIIWDMFRSRLNDYWFVSGNQIDHFVGGESEASISRPGVTFNTTYPDILRAILLLTGDIKFRSPGDGKTYVIKNVRGCPFVARQLRKLLDTLAVTDVGSVARHHA